MAIKKVLSYDNTIILACSECNRQKIVDMTEYLKNGNISKFKVRCKCGHSWYEFLEKRRFIRKSTNLPGSYILFNNGKAVDTGYMLVVEISIEAVKIRLNQKKDFKIGDTLEVDFILDNKSKTNIKRKVLVKKIDLPFVISAFEKTDHLNPDIGFYLAGIKKETNHMSLLQKAG